MPIPAKPIRRTLMHPGPAIAGLAGVTIAVSPYAYSLGVQLDALSGPQLIPQPWTLLIGCLALLLGGLAMNARRRWDQALVTTGVALILVSLAPKLVNNPSLALAVLLPAAALVFNAWESDQPFQVRSHAAIPTHAGLAAAAARAAVVTAAAAHLALAVYFRGSEPTGSLLGLALAVVLTLRWALIVRGDRPFAALPLSAAVIAVVFTFAANPTLAHLLLAAATLLVIPSPSARTITRTVVGTVVHHPAGPLVASFLALCVTGALLLHIPAASTMEGGISSIDALFTAVSAVCVTGLIVLDTPRDFTLLGQAIILLLIQLGALGIMSYSAAVIIALGRRLRLREESLIAASLNAGDRTQLRFVLKQLLWFTFVTEAIGAVLLAALFRAQGDTPLQAIWRGVFTSISAFCNAGFALQTDSLIPYQHEPLILHIVGALIVLGGLSPVAALAVPAVLRKKERRAQIYLVLSVSAILLVAGFFFIAAVEWNATLAGLSWVDRLHNAWFQSITLRTAGFNSVAFDSLQPATLLIMMVSMFIGGSPGGTAGGIKTTTAAILFLSIAVAIRGSEEISIFGRRISTAAVDRAAAIATLGALTAFVTILALLLTQAMPTSEAAFEAVSALGTVGLSLGGTARLDSVGKLIIAFAMFAGRVGPLSMFAFLATRETSRSAQYPVETIDVG